MLNAIAIIVDLAAINVWVGGMFFIIMVPGKVVATLEIPEQYSFWQHVLKRFFFWVWMAVIFLLTSGVGMILYRYGGLAMAPVHVQAMATLGILMAVVFFIIYFVFYQKFQRDLNSGNMEGSRHQLRVIRYLGIINMVLGFCVVIVIGGGPFLFSFVQ